MMFWHKQKIDRAEEAFKSECTKFLHKARQQRWKDKQDTVTFKEQHRQRNQKLRQKLKEENPKKVKALRRRQYKRERKGFRKCMPEERCCVCHKIGFDFVGATPEKIENLKRRSAESINRAQSADINLFQIKETQEWTKMSVVHEELAKNRQDKAENANEAEYVGAWEDDSDLEDEVDWKKIKPQWLLPWTSEWRKECDRIKKIVQWNIQHGTRERDARLRWKLKKIDKYLDWLWFAQLKMWKWREGPESSEQGEKEYLEEECVSSFKALLIVETWEILNRFCGSCSRPNIE